MPESDWVRVRQPETGHHVTIPRGVFDATPGLVELKSPAVDENGDPALPKYRVDKGSARDEASAETKES